MKLLRTPSSRVANLWLGLLREIFLQDGEADGLADVFFIGCGDNDPFGSRIGITWWKSKRYRRLERALALAIRHDMRVLTGISLNDFVCGISTTLRDNKLNRSLVRTLFAKSSVKTLHDAYSDNEPEQIAEALWQRYVRYVSTELDSWLFLYPLERVTTKNGSFECGEFCILAQSDRATYLRYCEDFPRLRSLDITTGALGQDMCLSTKSPLSWLLIEGNGTGDSVLDSGKQRASFFIGVLFSVIRIQSTVSPFTASSAEANGFVTAVSAGNSDYSFKGADRGPILHALPRTIDVSQGMLDVVSRWLNQCIAAAPSLRQRSETAAKWINHAALHRNHVRFLFFFFAIDALFGVRSGVERSIVNGVKSCMPGDWSQRCTWLFELRSELVHGGSASINEWKRYEKYCTHFESDPQDDIEEIAATCLVYFYSDALA